MASQDSIFKTKAKIEARKYAEEIFQIAKECESSDSDGQHGHFWKCLAGMVNEELAKYEDENASRPDCQQPRPMTSKEASVFEQTKIEFGKFEGHTIENVPLDYLEFLTQDSPLIRNLRRYLLNPTIAAELRKVVE